MFLLTQGQKDYATRLDKYPFFFAKDFQRKTETLEVQLQPVRPKSAALSLMLDLHSYNSCQQDQCSLSVYV